MRRTKGKRLRLPIGEFRLTQPDFTAFADHLATVSGDVILPFFRTDLRIDDKAGGGSRFDPVTEADRGAEAAMRAEIAAAFPDHGIVGEEYGTERPEAEHVWVLDPIDGTKAFVAGLPSWGTLIGLTQGGRASVGLVHQPFIGERFAGDGRSASYRGPAGARPLRTRRCGSFGDALLATTSPALFTAGQRAAYEAVEERTRLARYGFDCYAYCMLAAGHLDLVVEAGLKPYDVVALIPVIEGAGGVVTTWSGDRAEGGGTIVACGDPRLHEAALKLLADAA